MVMVAVAVVLLLVGEWMSPDDGVDFKLWNEQPENYPTCLATRPYPKARRPNSLFTPKLKEEAPQLAVRFMGGAPLRPPIADRVKRVTCLAGLRLFLLERIGL